MMFGDFGDLLDGRCRIVIVLVKDSASFAGRKDSGLILLRM